MVELVIDKKECCGCTACMNICPREAITMQPDEEGFLYPIINSDICSGCGFCNRVCAFKNGYETPDNFDEPVVYAAKHKSDEIRYASSSGGMFTALSDEILANGGIVYGVGFDEHMVVCHQRAENSNGRDKFRGSKYVQSELRQIFKLVAQDLLAGRYVLFSGTPCQVAGIKEYLKLAGINTRKLFLCDLVCHGTPSPLVFADYLKYCKQVYGRSVANHVFRSKNKGWGHTEANVLNNGHEDHSSYLSQLYKIIFYSHLALRPSCHNCKYTNLHRPGDVTLADYWGIDKMMPDFYDNYGISLVLVNTRKGQAIIDKIKTIVEFRQSSISDCLQNQPHLKMPPTPSPKRTAFWKDYHTSGFDHVARKYFDYGLKGSLKRLVKRVMIPLPVKRAIKNVLGI